jgi:hypothetical protein
MTSARSLDGRGYRANRSFDDMQNEDEAAADETQCLTVPGSLP